MAAEQSEIDADWFEEDPEDQETVRIGVMVGDDFETYDLPVSFIEQEFSDDSSRCQYFEEQLETMSIRVIRRWLSNR